MVLPVGRTRHLKVCKCVD